LPGQNRQAVRLPYNFLLLRAPASNRNRKTEHEHD